MFTRFFVWIASQAMTEKNLQINHFSTHILFLTEQYHMVILLSYYGKRSGRLRLLLIYQEVCRAFRVGWGLLL